MSQRFLPRLVAVMICLSVFPLASSSFAQGNKGKGGGNGGDTTDPPPAAPVSYTLDVIPVEGLTFGGDMQLSGAALNDDGLWLCTLETANVTSAEIVTDSDRALAIVDVHSGEITYVDNLLTTDTVWTNLPEGAIESDVAGYGINNEGDIIAGAAVLEGEVWSYSGYYLDCLRDEDGTITGYAPTLLVIGGFPFWLNDLGETIIELADGGPTRTSAPLTEFR